MSHFLRYVGLPLAPSTGWNWNLDMIQLTLINDDGEALVASRAPFFRITGAAVWTFRGEGYIARLRDGAWESKGRVWAGMRFEGQCRLVMGLPREPSAVSEILHSVSLSHDVLSANGIPFAVYNSARDMWRAAITDRWWHAFRIESSLDQKSLSGSAEDRAESGPDRPPRDSQASPQRGVRLQ